MTKLTNKFVLEVLFSSTLSGAAMSGALYACVLLPHAVVSGLSGRGGPLLNIDSDGTLVSLANQYLSTLLTSPATGIAIGAAASGIASLVTMGVFALGKGYRDEILDLTKPDYLMGRKSK